MSHRAKERDLCYFTVQFECVAAQQAAQRKGGEMKSLSKLVRVGVVVTVPALMLISAAPAGAKTKKAPKPTITGFASSPATVTTTNGHVTLSADVMNGTTCVFSETSGSSVSGLPYTTPCSSGSVSDTVNLPYNSGKKALKYKFELQVTGPGGAKDAKADVAVDGDDGSPQPMVDPVSGEPYNSIAASYGQNYWTQPVAGSDFAPNEDVDLTVDGNNVGEGTTDDEGNLDTTLTVPTVPDGQYELVATGQTAGDTATTTLDVGWDIYYEFTDSCSANTWTINGEWEGDGLDASSFYTITLTNGQQTEAESDSSGSFNAPFSFTADGGTTQTFTFAGPFAGEATTFAADPNSFGTC